MIHDKNLYGFAVIYVWCDSVFIDQSIEAAQPHIFKILENNHQFLFSICPETDFFIFDIIIIHFYLKAGLVRNEND